MANIKKPKLSNQLISDAFKVSKSSSVVISKKKYGDHHDSLKRKASKAQIDENEETKSTKEDTKADLDTLREFDLNQQYGPCIGITRMERWNRAQKLGLDPPLHVRQIIEFHSLDRNYLDCVWTAYNI